MNTNILISVGLCLSAVSLLSNFLLYRKITETKEHADKLYDISMAKQNGVDLPNQLL